jgi:Tfp pilus assembly protein PilF
MRPYHRIGFAGVGLALGVACGAGCQQLPQPPASLPGMRAPAVAAEPRPNARQVADLQMALGRSLEKGGDLPRASAAYLTALKHDPSRADAYARLAAVHASQGKFDEAAECFKKALAAQPGSADLYCDMGYMLYLQGRWDDARMNLRQALALAPDHERAHNNLGLVLARTGHAEDALREFHKAGCSPAAAQSNLAFALALEGRWDEAQAHYAQALAADPASAAARKGLREVQMTVARAKPAPAAAPNADTVLPADHRPGPRPEGE